MTNEKHILVGKTITEVLLAQDKEAILFKTTDGEIKALCDADCCSHTWVENIELPVNGLPATVTSADDIDLNDNLDTQNGELDFYGFKITTDKGDIVIDYRNESNGYYGGNLWWPKEDPEEYNRFYGGVHGQNISNEIWEPVL